MPISVSKKSAYFTTFIILKVVEKKNVICNDVMNWIVSPQIQILTSVVTVFEGRTLKEITEVKLTHKSGALIW